MSTSRDTSTRSDDPARRAQPRHLTGAAAREAARRMLHVAADDSDRQTIAQILLAGAPPIVAHVQHLVRNQYEELVPSGAAVPVDVTAQVVAMSMAERLGIVDNSDSSDQLFHAAVRCGQVAPWAGEVSVRVADSIVEHALATEPLEALRALAHLAQVSADDLAGEAELSVRLSAEEAALEDRTDRVWQDVREEHTSRAHQQLVQARAGGIDALVDLLLCVESPTEARATILNARR